MLYQQECYEIVGAAMKVYNTLGPGFLEAVYHEALEIEFDKCKILFDSEKSIDIFYDGVCLKQKYRPDFFCMNKIIVEIKAQSQLDNANVAQVINYLHATKMRLGLLINFGNPNVLEWRRIVL
jgi:GxxExxY protein